MTANSMDSTRIDAIRLFQGGDRVAFERLLRPELGRLVRIAAAIVGNEADATDVVQETLVIAWRKSSSLRDAQNFRAWLTRILINESRHVLRDRSRRRVREIDAAAGLDRTNAPGEFEEKVVRHDALERAFEQLDAKQRALLVLHHLNDEPLGDIAFALDVPVGTVKSHLSSARSALSAALAKEDRDANR